MTEQDIINAYVRIREIDNTIPDEVLDFMKQSSIDTLKLLNYGKKRREMKEVVESPNSRFGWKKESSHYRSWRFGMRDLEGAYQLEMEHEDDESDFDCRKYFKNAHLKRQTICFEIEGYPGHFKTTSTNHKFLPTITHYVENDEQEFMVMDWHNDHIKVLSTDDILYEDYESEDLDNRMDTFDFDKITIL